MPSNSSTPGQQSTSSQGGNSKRYVALEYRDDPDSNQTLRFDLNSSKMTFCQGSIQEINQIATAEFGPEFECQSCASGVQRAWRRMEDARSGRASHESHAASCDKPLCGPLGRIAWNDEKRAASTALVDRTRHVATTHANGDGPCDTTDEVLGLLCSPM